MASDETTPEQTLRVLFIGNSLTYTNDLPATVAAIAQADTARPLHYETVALPDFSLQDHWLLSDARSVLAEGDWDFVVLQQGPSSLPENQEHLRTWALRFAEEAQAANATPALYMVWPSADRRFAFDDVVASYAQAAEAANAVLLPAGTAWLEAWKRDPSLDLYGSDGFHPSPLGTYLVALVVYGGLYEQLPERLPDRPRVGDAELRLSDAVASHLLQAAQEALAHPTGPDPE